MSVKITVVRRYYNGNTYVTVTTSFPVASTSMMGINQGTDDKFHGLKIVYFP